MCIIPLLHRIPRRTVWFYFRALPDAIDSCFLLRELLASAGPIARQLQDAVRLEIKARGDTRAAAAKGLVGVGDLAAGDTGPAGASRSYRAATAADSPPAVPPERRAVGSTA